MGSDNRVLDMFGKVSGFGEIVVEVCMGEGTIKVQAGAIRAGVVHCSINEMEVFSSRVCHIVTLVEFGSM